MQPVPFRPENLPAGATPFTSGYPVGRSCFPNRNINKQDVLGCKWSRTCRVKRRADHPLTGRFMRRRTWLLALWLVQPALLLAVVTPASPVRLSTFGRPASNISRTLTRASRFVDVPHLNLRSACEQIHLGVPRPENKSQLHHWNRWSRSQPAHS
jgi:hypothetical protein